MALFLVLVAIILFFFFLYRRRRTLQAREVQQLHQQFREQSLKAQLEIQEQTFQALSQEIHDNVGQILSLARIQVNIMTETKRMDEDLLQGMKDNIGKALADLRDLAGSMNGERIRQWPIHKLLELELERIHRSGIMHGTLLTSGNPKDIDPSKKLIVFRILQEAIQNCIKHSEASEMIISIAYEEPHVCFEVRDNGTGFDTDTALQNATGLGLGNMQMRIRLTGGSCKIKSQLGQGTNITITTPYA